MRTRAAALLLLAAGGLLATPARAHAGCEIRVTSVLFDVYNVFSGSPRDSTGRVEYLCGKQDKGIRIILSRGSSGGYRPRKLERLAAPKEWLEYNLFKDGFADIWGDGSDGTAFYYERNPKNDQWVPLTIYGRIFAGQDVSAGDYADTVQVEIDF